MSDNYRNLLYEMRTAFAVQRPTSFAIISGVTDYGPPTLGRHLAVEWVNQACRRWYEEQR